MQPTTGFIEPQAVGERTDVEPRAITRETVDRGQTFRIRARVALSELPAVELNKAARERADEQAPVVCVERSDCLWFAIRPMVLFKVFAVESCETLRARADKQPTVPSGETGQIAFGQTVEHRVVS